MVGNLGSLFDGIGGFPLAGRRYGITPVWASEIEPWPIKVTEYHYPDMVHLGDIAQISGAEIEPVDIITFGSPCQDLSVAGKRAGLEGERSGLFGEAVRIIREMRESTNGVYPRFAVWENVPGAYSSNKGQDFRAVLEEITETEIPMPESGKWAEAGMVRIGNCDIAWRTLDAQYWGVPQRRKRIFLVADFGGTSASEILFVEQGLRRDTETSGESGQEAAGAIGEGTCFAIDHVITTGGNCTAQGPCYAENGPMFTLKAAGSHAVAHGVPVSTYWDGGQISDCLDCSMLAKGQMMPDKRRFPAVLYDMTHVDEVMRPVAEGLAPTLNARMGTGGNQIPVLMSTTARTLTARNDGSPCVDRGPEVVVQNYAVRRLAPIEALRLQGFPDNWLDIEGMSDTAKYKAIGNSVAVPCVEFVMSGIARVMKENNQCR